MIKRKDQYRGYAPQYWSTDISANFLCVFFAGITFSARFLHVLMGISFYFFASFAGLFSQ